MRGWFRGLIFSSPSCLATHLDHTTFVGFLDESAQIVMLPSKFHFQQALHTARPPG